MAYNWIGGPLSGIGAGLMAAGAGGWQQFAPAMAVGQQQYDQQQAQGQENEYRKLLADATRQKMEDDRLANTREAEKAARLHDLIASLGGGMMSPGASGPHAAQQPGIGQGLMGGQQIPQAALALADATGDVSFIKPYLTPKEEKTPTIGATRDFLRGNQKITQEWNGQSWADLGSGPAYAPDHGGQNEYGLQPVYTKDEKGTLHAWQLAKGGGWQEIPVPPGQQFAPALSMQDLGTSVQPMNTRTGAPEGPGIAKDVAGAAAASKLGTDTGQAQFDLPSIEARAQQALNLIDEIKKDPSRTWATGATSLSTNIPATPMFNFGKKVDQLKGTAFLQAYNLLKGAGAITEIEGQKAENAIARLDTRLKDDDFISALDDLAEVVTSGVAVARSRAGQQSAPSPAPAQSPSQATTPSAPAVGQVEDGYKFKGGDPSNPANWEKVSQ